ncbi:hypothetical protein X976_5410 [Burkholderia pseudomallei MSHR7500]|nr:hypothetical protein X990_5445 [Burkholderia pseudomallei MSHR4868]KGS86183.1 hypothetical protein X976_5410 [Burkholderia pseudomallei MSHR7500]
MSVACNHVCATIAGTTYAVSIARDDDACRLPPRLPRRASHG